MRKLLPFVLLFGVCSVATGQDAAQSAVEVRQAVLTLMKTNFGPLAGMARDKVEYSAETAAVKAERLAQLANMLGDAFAYDTRGYGGETDALDAIWGNPDDFSDKVQNAVKQAEALSAIAGNGKSSEFLQAVGSMGKACGGCHDEYKVDD